MRPIHVYLDSSDYSVLSDRRYPSNDSLKLLAQISSLVDKGAISCWFSGIHLSEMAPLNSAYAGAANHRADVLVRLCGRNALLSIDRVVNKEIRSTLGLASDSATSVYALDGTWYPEGVAEILPFSDRDRFELVRTAVDKMAGNRKLRRLALSRATKHGRIRPELRAHLSSEVQTASIQQLLDEYPMSEEVARVIGQYLVGSATRAQATAAFEENLRDPRWMMSWFSKHHVKLLRFINWTRAPASNLNCAFQQMVDLSKNMRANDALNRTNISDTVFTSKKWHEVQNKLLVRVVTRIATMRCNERLISLTTESIDEHCPGISVSIRSLHSAWWASTTKTPRKTKPSDVVDALHAFYAPYVDIFRADSAMAPAIQKHASRYGTQVVTKLADLIGTIEKHPAIRS